MGKIKIFVVAIIIISCNSNNQNEREWLNNYNEALLSFNPELVSHFPNDLTHFERRKLYYYAPNSVKRNGFTGIILDGSTDSTFFYENYNQIKTRDIRSVSITSDSLVFIEKDTIYHCSNCYPIISFSDVKDQFGIKNRKLNRCEEVFFIELSHDSFLDENENKTDEWNHGMSRGIVFDKNEYRMLYWMVVW